MYWICQFGHIVNGYASGYYGYQWSKSFATDIYYTKFKTNPMDKTNGNQYRQQVLCVGAKLDRQRLQPKHSFWK